MAAVKRPAHVPYQHVPKKHAKYLLAKLAEFRELQGGVHGPYADTAVLACLVGTLQHYAGEKP